MVLEAKEQIYWAGLDTIHGITSSGSYSLEIELTTGGQTKTVKWGTFTIGSESNKYQLSLSGFDAGTSGLQDGLTPHNGMFFSTRDVDNDQWSGACSSQYGNTGWWYKDCAVTNLNIAHTSGPWYATVFYDESRMILKRYSTFQRFIVVIRLNQIKQNKIESFIKFMFRNVVTTTAMTTAAPGSGISIMSMTENFLIGINIIDKLYFPHLLKYQKHFRDRLYKSTTETLQRC